jgi:hypothetical protein
MRATSKPADTLSGTTSAPKKQEMLNKNVKNALPPEVEGSTYGHLFVEIGNLNWLIYDNENYLEPASGGTKPIFNLFTNIKFWGDKTKGIYLK